MRSAYNRLGEDDKMHACSFVGAKPLTVLDVLLRCQYRKAYSWSTNTAYYHTFFKVLAKLNSLINMLSLLG